MYIDICECGECGECGEGGVVFRVIKALESGRRMSAHTMLSVETFISLFALIAGSARKIGERYFAR